MGSGQQVEPTIGASSGIRCVSPLLARSPARRLDGVPGWLVQGVVDWRSTRVRPPAAPGGTRRWWHEPRVNLMPPATRLYETGPSDWVGM